MKIVNKLKLLITFYVIVLVLLLLSVIAMPMVIRHGLTVGRRLVIEEESLETVLIILLFGVSYFLLRGFKSTLGAYERAVKRAGLDKSRLTSRTAIRSSAHASRIWICSRFASCAIRRVSADSLLSSASEDASIGLHLLYAM